MQNRNCTNLDRMYMNRNYSHMMQNRRNTNLNRMYMTPIHRNLV